MPPIQAPSALARSGPGPAAAGGGQGGGGPPWGGGGAAGAMAAVLRSAPGAGWDAWGRGRGGPSWRRRRRASVGHRSPPSLVLPGSPSPRAWEREGPLRPTLLPGAGLGCSGRRDLGTGMVLSEASEAPLEVSRALPPLSASRAQLSGEQGTAVDAPPPPALLQALPAPAGSAGRWMGD